MNRSDIESMIRSRELQQADFYTANSLMKALGIVPDWQWRDATNQALVACAKSSEEFPNKAHVLDWFKGPGKLYR